MHRRRYLADGDAGEAEPLRAPNGAGFINADGYRTFYVPGADAAWESTSSSWKRSSADA